MMLLVVNTKTLIHSHITKDVSNHLIIYLVKYKIIVPLNTNKNVNFKSKRIPPMVQIITFTSYIFLPLLYSPGFSLFWLFLCSIYFLSSLSISFFFPSYLSHPIIPSTLSMLFSFPISILLLFSLSLSSLRRLSPILHHSSTAFLSICSSLYPQSHFQSFSFIFLASSLFLPPISTFPLLSLFLLSPLFQSLVSLFSYLHHYSSLLPPSSLSLSRFLALSLLSFTLTHISTIPLLSLSSLLFLYLISPNFFILSLHLLPPSPRQTST